MTALIVLYQFIIFSIFIYLYKNLIFENNYIHLSSFHFVYFFVFYFVGASQLYIDGGAVNNNYLFSVTLYPVVVVLGMYSSKLLTKKNSNYLIARIKFFKYVCLFSIVVSFVYALSLEKLPIFSILEGDFIGAAVDRSNATKEYTGPKALYYAFRVIVDYFLIYILIFVYVRFEKITILFVTLLTIALIISLFDFQKYPAINLLVMLSMAIFIYNRSKLPGRMSFRTLINLKVLLVLFFSYILLGALWAASSVGFNDRNITQIAESIIFAANSMVGDRLIFGENRPLYSVYQIVPAQFDYFLGLTLPNPLRILPFEPVQFSYIVYDYVHPHGDGIDGVRGAAPTAFFSVIYANFGIVASFISIFFFGFIVQIINDKLLYGGKYIIPIRFVFINYVSLFATSIDYFFMSEKIFLILILYFIMYRSIHKE